MRYSPVFYSLSLHGAMIAAAVLGLPHWFRPPPMVAAPIVVELVRIEEETRIVEPPVEAPKPVIAKPKPKPEPVKESRSVREPPPAPPPEPEPLVVEKKPPPPLPEPVKEKKVAALPPPREPVAKPEPKPIAEPKPLPVVKPKPEPSPKPEPAPQVKQVEQVEPPKPVKIFANVPQPKTKPDLKRKKKKKLFDQVRLAALLDKSDPEPDARRSEKSRKRAQRPQPVPSSARAKFGLEMTISEIDAIRRQIEQCWSVPAGARDARDLLVEIRVFLNPDGSLAKAPEIVDKQRMFLPGQVSYRTAAESARRAVNICAPFKGLPAEKFDSWRVITLRFNPKDMVGG